MLLVAAFIWGTAFVAQKIGGDIGTFTYNGIRMTIGGLVLIPVALISDRGSVAKAAYSEKSPEEKAKARRILILGGIVCGVILFFGTNLQQLGLAYTTAGKAGFITSLYTIFVPIVSILVGKRVRPVIWLCAVMGVFGLYLLSMAGGGAFRLSRGDLLILLCSFCFTFHIMSIDYFSPRVNGIKLSCIQFFVAGALSLIVMAVTEHPDLHVILHYWTSILYTGILSSAVGYTLQIVAQKHAEPTQATLIMCMESVFAALAGAVVLSERMSGREFLGCAIIFIAVIISVLPERKGRSSLKG